MKTPLFQLGDRILAMSGKRRIAFAAAIAERLLPHYVAFCGELGWGNAGLYRDALDRVWKVASGEAVLHADEYQSLEGDLADACPDMDVHPDFEALEACTAVQNALLACIDTAAAANSADVALHCASYSCDMYENDPHYWSDPVVCQELEIQNRLIDELTSLGDLQARILLEFRKRYA